MDNQLVGAIVLTVNGREFDCASVTPEHQVGRKLVSTMNSKRRANKQVRLTASISLSFDVYIPETGDFDWASIEDANLTIESVDGGHRTTYTGVGVISVGEKFTDGSEAMRSITGYATDKVEESI